MKKKATRIILITLVALAVLIVATIAIVRQFGNTTVDPHAGHDHSTGETHATQTPTSYVKPSDCYTLTENKDGTYSFAIRNYMGGTMYHEKNISNKPTFTQVNDYVLSASGMDSKENNLSGWAVFCNIRSLDVSQRYEHVLALVDNKVAYLDRMSDKWVVITYAPLDRSVEMGVTELPGLTISETGNPKITYKTTDKGELKVSYTTEDGDQTVTVKLGE